MHGRPVGPGSAHPNGGVALVVPGTVDAHADHPVALREELIEMRLMVCARPVVVGNEIHGGPPPDRVGRSRRTARGLVE